MTLIISNENDDSTNNVMKHFFANNMEVIRLTEKRFVSGLNLKLNNNGLFIQLKVANKSFNLDKVKSFWFRKNDLELFKNTEVITDKTEELESIRRFIFNSEIKSIKEFLIFILEKKKYLGNFSKGDGNKLISFYHANDVGLRIPNTIVSSKTSFLKKHSLNQQSIIKPIEDGFGAIINEYWYYTKYNMLRDNNFRHRTDQILPSCLQDYIEKKIEIRVFYLDGKCHSMAIFSQLDNRTKIDFRNYNYEKLNRMVPYKLPKEIELKINKFMKKMDLNTGSIDLILDKQNQYVFLEVNPVGQYGMIQTNCNYNLDQLIFEKLNYEEK